MAIDKNEVFRIFKKVPEITEKELPDLKTKIKWVETQIQELSKAMYRFNLEVKTARNFATKDDPDVQAAVENKVNEAVGNIKGIKWTLETLRKELAELKNSASSTTAK